MQKEWFSSWFDTPYYHILYKNRDYSEASLFIDNITQFLNLKPNAVCWDLCCGKGRHSIYLNQKGYRVIGTDLSEQSILEANKSANDTLQFYQHDMRKLFRTNYFDAVFNLFTSFGYFERREDDLHVFDAVQKSLMPNGLFVFDYLNAEYVKSILTCHDEKTIDGITFNISKKIENNTVIKTIDFTDKGESFHYEERVKLFDKSYFESLAKECNLTLLHTFGNYQLQEFNNKTSPRLILVLQKK
ncbi:MAG: methyltransferase [Bacteroidetes bacterium]|jgi:SAM-dependent methyltransferase|nr:methyltransferase [Bacteroidota bacterium]MDF2453437.1 methyltransferase [Bacteroidota bacterium]